MNTITTTMTFQGITLKPLHRENQTWFRLPEIEAALGYASKGRALAKIYASHADEFTAGMTRVVKLATAGGKQAVRIFSLRGAHLLAMFSKTTTAKKFRIWVLDILDAEVVRQAAPQSVTCLSNVQRIELEGLCAETAFMSAWFKKFGPAIELLNPRLFSGTFEMPMTAGWRAKFLAKEFDLNVKDGYYDKYPWHETPGQQIQHYDAFMRGTK